ncbi:GNAT family N-acetyltransferase [Alteromonas sp. a30]|uniref:GNAT family N-acetyltransferase n=1 Tax=Alteromonas sp. a30 TaxID=2730917 RepID=UPI002280E74B|nr:GNAT family N-acetyltransferase [Alteromonas sp. a30]MCY7296154.1 GNAT family N-acetyltransferase [Alteromonas sp. a30]
MTLPFSRSALVRQQVAALASQQRKTLPELGELRQLEPKTVSYRQRISVLNKLRKVLDAELLNLSQPAIHDLIKLARYLCDWPSLKRLQPVVPTMLNPKEVALSERQMGRFDIAMTQIEQELLKFPSNKTLLYAREQVKRDWEAIPYSLQDLRADKINITPMMSNHVADFAWQYNDSDIAKRCSLPKFPSPKHWMHWLNLCLFDSNRHLFSVMHQDYGFIGSVSLQVYQDIGFFYYWLGPDFQGKGLGPKAVKILMQVGTKYHAMKQCYAKVFDYNTPSHKAIQKLGFSRLPFSALPPSEAEVFYYRDFTGSHQTSNQLHQQLSQLLQQLRSDIRLKPLLG